MNFIGKVGLVPSSDPTPTTLLQNLSSEQVLMQINNDRLTAFDPGQPG